MNLQEALDTALEISTPRLHDSLDPTEFAALGVIEAAARSVVEGTNIQWCEYHNAQIVNPRDGVCWDAESFHDCRIVSRRLVEWEDTDG